MNRMVVAPKSSRDRFKGLHKRKRSVDIKHFMLTRSKYFLRDRRR